MRSAKVTEYYGNSMNAFQKENLSYLVEEHIKDKILRCLYKEGDRVLEASIAEELGISRGPVREGIKMAEQSGILTIEPRKGAYVTRFDKNDIQEVFEIRVMLESSILEDLIEKKKVTDKDFAILEKLIDQMVGIANSSQDKQEVLLALNKKDIEFHQYIWKKSGSKRKQKILNGLFFQLRLAMLYDTKFTQKLIVTATDHYNILRNLKKNDLEGCKRALREHIFTYE
jgi:DNA-binding GntR family transcriptional regulator